jgi:phosphate transport system substrate-binding protein
MNDEFLYRLRAEPRPEFAARLKVKLDRQSARAPAARLVRGFILASLLTASAFAVMSPGVRQKAATLFDQFRPAHGSQAAAVSPEPQPPQSTPPAAPRAGTIPETAAAPTAPAAQIPSPFDQGTPDRAPDALAPSARSGGALMTPPVAAYGTASRINVHVVGSAIAHPFAKAVGKQFARTAAFPEPQVDNTGTGGGVAAFCRGPGMSSPDIVQASRPMLPSEVEQCAKNGVEDIRELKLGYYAVLVLRSAAAEEAALTSRDIYLALARHVPGSSDQSMPTPNPYRTWHDVNASLPARAIRVFGPSLSSPVRDTFAELILHTGCDSFPQVTALRNLDRGLYERACHEIRQDGLFVHGGTLPLLQADANAFGLFGYEVLDANHETLVAVPLDGVTPSLETITSGKYPASRTLYLYLNGAHLGAVPGLRQFVASYVSDGAIGPQGYLVALGLIPLDRAERHVTQIEALSRRVPNP